jgi:hypothetical protein
MSVKRGTVMLITCATVLAACSGSGSVNVGSGQTADPATVDFPIFYVKRTIPENPDDIRQLRDAVGDADLFMRDRASPSAPERNITERVTGTEDVYDVKDVEVSFDGKKVIFAMRGPLRQNMDEEDPPTWNIWEYDIPSDTLRRVIPSDTIAEEGQDVAPHYLPDGRIVFSSTRQRQSKAILLDEGKPQFEAQNQSANESAFVLHVMDEFGGNIRQISFNQAHDLDPTVLSDGRVMWSRWENAPGGNTGIHLYTANPDGTEYELLYGANSHNTGRGRNPDGSITQNEVIQFVRAREMQDGRILALVRAYTDTDFGGDLVIIDTRTYVENTQPTLANAGMQGPAQTRATPNIVNTVEGPSPGGRFQSAFPLWDGTNRILVSWSQCRLLDTTVTPSVIVPCTDDRLADPDAQTAPPLYSVWMFDPAQNTLMPIMTPEEGVMITDVVAAQPRPLPPVILDDVPNLDVDPDLVSEGVGVIHIRSVYDRDGVDTATPNFRALADGNTPAAQRPARFVRIEKPVSMPDNDVRNISNAAFGVGNTMREILAYAPIEPDGSVKIKVPANVAFSISILDENGRRLPNFPQHTNWLQVRPGEVVECNGCHTPSTPQNPRSHGRKGLFAPINTGASLTGVAFPNSNPAFSPDAGETMAETRTRTDRTALTPSVNVVYTDVWSVTPGTNPDILLRYNDPTFTTPPPTTDACIANWSSTCRIIINYPQHIQPLWDKVRQIIDPNNGMVLEDHTCSRAGCHNPTNDMDMPMVPAGQLDLTAVPSDEQPLHLRSYRELLFTDNAQVLNMGALTDECAQLDPDTGVCLAFVTAGPYLNAGSARGARSNAFLSRFAPGGAHAGYLSPAELRLLSEWLDIGAQYFNNPFDPAVPLN